MLIVAWRGGVEFGKENSLESIRSSVKCADIIEFDVRKTKDNKLVLFHDNRIKSIGNLAVKDLSFKELSEKGLKLTTLEEALEIVTKRKIAMIDVKDKHVEKILLETIKNYDRSRILINSLQKDVLLSLRKLDKEIKISLGISRKFENFTYLKKIMEKLNPWCVTPFKENTEFIAYVLENYKNVKVIPWLVRDETDLQKVSNCHGIVTPYPCKMRRFLLRIGMVVKNAKSAIDLLEQNYSRKLMGERHSG